MQKTPLLLLGTVGLALLFSGCSSTHKTSRQRYHKTESGFMDTAARSAYMDRRVSEMTEKGMTKESAVAQASREWFNQSSAASETPTAWERQRRQAQADFEAALIKQKKEKEAGVR